MENKKAKRTVIGYRLKAHFKTDGVLNISSSNIELKAGRVYNGDSPEWGEIQRLLAQPNSWILKSISPVYKGRELEVKG